MPKSILLLLPCYFTINTCFYFLILNIFDAFIFNQFFLNENCNFSSSLIYISVHEHKNSSSNSIFLDLKNYILYFTRHDELQEVSSKWHRELQLSVVERQALTQSLQQIENQLKDLKSQREREFQFMKQRISSVISQEWDTLQTSFSIPSFDDKANKILT